MVVRWLLWLPMVGAVVGVIAVGSHIERSAWESLWRDGDRAAAVVDAEWGEVRLVYRHVAAGEVSVPVNREGLAEGDQVMVVADRDDPYRLIVDGDEPPGRWALMVVVLGVAAAGTLLGAMWLSASKFRRVANSEEPAFRMLSAVHRVGWSMVPRLSLYPIDAVPGTRPLCTVRLADLSVVSMGGRAVPVDVKGLARPGARVVARRGTTVLWPRGVALITADHALSMTMFASPRVLTDYGEVEPGDEASDSRGWDPPAPLEFPNRAMREWTGVLSSVLVAGVAVTGIVAALTLRSHQATEEWVAEGVSAVAVISDRQDDDFAVAVDVTPQSGAGTARAMLAPADFPEDYRVGDRYPAVVRRDGTMVRLLAEPYDPVEPIAWPAIPTVVIGWHLLRRRFGC